jgi:hypothetical protein
LPGVPGLPARRWGRASAALCACDAANTPQAHVQAIPADADPDAGPSHADGVYSDADPRPPDVYAHGDLYAYAHADADEHA